MITPLEPPHTSIVQLKYNMHSLNPPKKWLYIPGIKNQQGAIYVTCKQKVLGWACNTMFAYLHTCPSWDGREPRLALLGSTAEHDLHSIVHHLTSFWKFKNSGSTKICKQTDDASGAMMMSTSDSNLVQITGTTSWLSVGPAQARLTTQLAKIVNFLGACEVLNLVTKIFVSRFSKLSLSDVWLPPFMARWDTQQFYPPYFAVQNATNFSRNPDSRPPHAIVWSVHVWPRLLSHSAR